MLNLSKSFALSDCRVGTAHQSRFCHCEQSEAISLHHSLFLVRHSIFTTTFAFLLVLFLIAVPAQAKYGGGTGEPNDPYLIFDANQMNAIGADSNDWDKHFILMADINLSGFTGTEFNIIGIHYYNEFTGVFDGNGHTISNFTYTSTATTCIGLLGYVDDPNAEIKDLGLIDPNVDAGTGRDVGSLVGFVKDGTITNCYVEGGSVSGVDYVGGLVGNAYYGTISNCYSTGSATGTGDYVGGLVGRNRATISDCYATGDVSGDYDVGGLVGENYRGTITKCYSTGSVSGNRYVGGLVGWNRGTVPDSFWDIETSGQTTSAGGTGLTTAEMQAASTFIGWGACGNKGIWTLDEGNDYPHLWWEEKPGDPLPAYQLSDFITGAGTQIDPYLIYTAEQFNMIGLFLCDWDKHFKLMADIDLNGFTRTSFNIIGTDYYYPFAGVFDGNGHTISNFSYVSTGTSYIGLFGYVDDPNAEIKDLGLIDPNIDGVTGGVVGSLVGKLRNATITNCYVQGGSVSGNDCPGGLVGENYGTIANCHSTGSVTGDGPAGGLVGYNRGAISNCYASGDISGTARVGGLVGWNGDGTITNSYSTGSVSGDRSVSGLVGENYGTITNCYSAGSVTGDHWVGGLVGANFYNGTIFNCYSTANVSGSGFWYGIVGGLVGYNFRGTITNCYSTGSVSGYNNVGGLVGYNEEGEVLSSFWDIETSGQSTSASGTPKTTTEMQTESTFTDAGWDFVGETFNGIEDIWFIPQQDYPHLWWEGMQVPMKLTPRTLNCRSKGNWVKAHLTLPQGFTVEDVDSNRPAVLHSFGFQSAPLHVFVNENELVEIEAAFEREAVCSLAGDCPQALTVAGFLTDGNIFLGTSTVRMIAPGMKDIEELALYWLNKDCVHPDFCDQIDMNRDSMVNLLDYALLLNSQVEFVSE